MTTSLFPSAAPASSVSALPAKETAPRAVARKAPNAFRTISETADELQVPQHVLRFWETKFPQLRPIKRGGGRRYYRPEDLDLLRRISSLLYVEGYTIKAVQRLLREGMPQDDAADTANDGPEDVDEADGQKMLDLPENTPSAAKPGISPALRSVLSTILSELEEWRHTLKDDAEK